MYTDLPPYGLEGGVLRESFKMNPWKMLWQVVNCLFLMILHFDYKFEFCPHALKGKVSFFENMTTCSYSQLNL